MPNRSGGRDQQAPKPVPLVERRGLARALGLTEPLRATAVLLIGQDSFADGEPLSIDLHDAAANSVLLELDGNAVLVDCVAERLIRSHSAPAEGAISPALLAVAVTAMSAPAEAEGLARRVARRLEAEQIRGWAVGVAVSHRTDSAIDLVGFAERALIEAQVLGGNQVVVFDDVEREPTVTTFDQGT